jgi:hypothetical protein
MTQNPDNFNNLQRLLRWKRNEQPPPRYFNNFSRGIIVQIERMNEINQDPFWVRWFRNFDPKPILVCAYGLAVGGTLLFGFSFFGMGEGNPRSSSASQGMWLAGGSPPLSIKNDLSSLGNLAEVSGALPLVPASARGMNVPAFLFDGSGLKSEWTKANYLFQER